MVPNHTRIRHILLIPLLLILATALPLSVSAAGTGTITAPADHIEEGGILQLSTNMSGTVTWTSSNTGLATVSSTGRVSGIQAGQVIITARCSGYADATITLWVLCRTAFITSKTHLPATVCRQRKIPPMSMPRTPVRKTASTNSGKSPIFPTATM